MGGVFRSWKWWWNNLRGFFLDKRVVRGEMSLGYGDWEYVIQTPQGRPSQVSVSVEEPCDATTVCMGNINLAGAKLLPDGFVLYVKVQSNACIVKWIVEFEANIEEDLQMLDTFQ